MVELIQNNQTIILPVFEKYQPVFRSWENYFHEWLSYFYDDDKTTRSPPEMIISDLDLDNGVKITFSIQDKGKGKIPMIVDFTYKGENDGQPELKISLTEIEIQVLWQKIDNLYQSK